MTAPAVLNHAPDLAQIGAALRRARRGAGITLDTAGTHIGRDLSTVAKYERGLIDPPGSVLAALAGLYGVHPGVFFAPTT